MFFTDFHSELIHTIKELLDTENNESSAIIIAPQRGNTLNVFLEKCKGIFEINFIFSGKKLNEKMKQLELEENYNLNSDFLHFLELKIKNK